MKEIIDAIIKPFVKATNKYIYKYALKVTGIEKEARDLSEKTSKFNEDLKKHILLGDGRIYRDKKYFDGYNEYKKHYEDLLNKQKEWNKTKAWWVKFAVTVFIGVLMKKINDLRKEMERRAKEYLLIIKKMDDDTNALKKKIEKLDIDVKDKEKAIAITIASASFIKKMFTISYKRQVLSIENEIKNLGEQIVKCKDQLEKNQSELSMYNPVVLSLVRNLSIAQINKI